MGDAIGTAVGATVGAAVGDSVGDVVGDAAAFFKRMRSDMKIRSTAIAAQLEHHKRLRCNSIFIHSFKSLQPLHQLN